MSRYETLSRHNLDARDQSTDEALRDWAVAVLMLLCGCEVAEEGRLQEVGGHDLSFSQEGISRRAFPGNRIRTPHSQADEEIFGDG